MSVSDVIVLHENGVDTAHFCDSIGFVEVPQFLLPAPSVNLETIGLTVDGHLGTWHTIDSRKIGGRDFFQMEHDEFGSTVANIVVDCIWRVPTAGFAEQNGRNAKLNSR